MNLKISLENGVEKQKGKNPLLSLSLWLAKPNRVRPPLPLRGPAQPVPSLECSRHAHQGTPWPPAMAHTARAHFRPCFEHRQVRLAPLSLLVQSVFDLMHCSSRTSSASELLAASHGKPRWELWFQPPASPSLSPISNLHRPSGKSTATNAPYPFAGPFLKRPPTSLYSRAQSLDREIPGISLFF